MAVTGGLHPHMSTCHVSYGTLIVNVCHFINNSKAEDNCYNCMIILVASTLLIMCHTQQSVIIECLKTLSSLIYSLSKHEHWLIGSGKM